MKIITSLFLVAGVFLFSFAANVQAAATPPSLDACSEVEGARDGVNMERYIARFGRRMTYSEQKVITLFLKNDGNGFYALGKRIFTARASVPTLQKARVLFMAASLRNVKGADAMIKKIDAKLSTDEELDSQALHSKLYSKSLEIKNSDRPADCTAALDNVQRRADLDMILLGLQGCKEEHNGKLPSKISVGKQMELCGAEASSCAGLLNLNKDLEMFIFMMPSDPAVSKASKGTRYFIKLSADGKITLSAPDAVRETITVVE